MTKTGDVREGVQPEAPQSRLKSAAPLARRHCEEGLCEQGCLVRKKQPASYTASFSRNRRDAKVTIGPVCEAAASYTGSTADKQTFLLHWQAGGIPLWVRANTAVSLLRELGPLISTLGTVDINRYIPLELYDAPKLCICCCSWMRRSISLRITFRLMMPTGIPMILRGLGKHPCRSAIDFLFGGTCIGGGSMHSFLVACPALPSICFWVLLNSSGSTAHATWCDLVCNLNACACSEV